MLHQPQQINKPKQIVIETSNSSVVYTVPKGKIFKGTCYGNDITNKPTVIINGVSVPHDVKNQALTYPNNNGQMELFEGDTISFYTQSGMSAYLVGVEYDA